MKAIDTIKKLRVKIGSLHEIPDVPNIEYPVVHQLDYTDAMQHALTATEYDTKINQYQAKIASLNINTANELSAFGTLWNDKILKSYYKTSIFDRLINRPPEEKPQVMEFSRSLLDSVNDEICFGIPLKNWFVCVVMDSEVIKKHEARMVPIHMDGQHVEFSLKYLHGTLGDYHKVADLYIVNPVHQMMIRTLNWDGRWPENFSFPLKSVYTGAFDNDTVLTAAFIATNFPLTNGKETIS